jgi:hypothetical protein
MKQRVLLLLVVPTLLAVQVCSVLADDNKALSASEIINKHIEAIGGKAALAKLKSRLVLGTIKKENEADAQFAIASEPNRVSALYRFKEFNWRFIYDGKKASEMPNLPQQMHVVYEKYVEIVASGLMFNDISLFNLVDQGESGSARFEAKGMKKFHGRPTYIVEMRRGHEEPMKLYFDAETFMWVRTDYGKAHIRKQQHMSNGSGLANDNNQHPEMAPSHADDDTIADFYIETSDFKEVDGIKLPFKFVQVATYPILQQKIVGTVEGTIKEYFHNVTVDPKSYQ